MSSIPKRVPPRLVAVAAPVCTVVVLCTVSGSVFTPGLVRAAGEGAPDRGIAATIVRLATAGVVRNGFERRGV